MFLVKNPLLPMSEKSNNEGEAIAFLLKGV